MTTRLQPRTTFQKCFEETAGTPLWNDAALNEYLAAAIRAQGAHFPPQATYADPNDMEAEVQACTARRSRTGQVGEKSGVVGFPV